MVRRTLILALALAALAAAPAGATTNIGGGEAHGTVTFAAPGVPPAFAPCAPVTFTMKATATAFFFNTSIDGFLGTVPFNGAGSSSCEGTTSGGGPLTLTVPKTTSVNGSTFECPQLTGGYTRVGTDVEAILGGNCSVNSNSVPAMFVFKGEFTPSGGSGLDQPGVSRPITNASFEGSIAVLPA